MGGWIAMIALVLAVAACLYPFARRDKGALQFLAAALLLALAGYSWQGRPDQPGSPKAAAAASQLPDDDFAILRQDLLGRFDRASYWMTLADADRRAGNPRGAAEILEAAVRRNPRDAGLWIAFGYALVAGGDDMMSPAALLAFNRASQLAPLHPGPQFFYGLALARGGNYDEAERVWRQLLPGLGPHPQYRAVVMERLAAIQEARASGTVVRPAAPPPPSPTAPPGPPQPQPPAAR